MASGVTEAIRPAFAPSTIALLLTATAHALQYFRRCETAAPHVWQTLCGSGAGASDLSESLRIVSRQRCRVRRDRGPSRVESGDVEQTACANHSASGAASARHFSVVSPSRDASAGIR